MSSDFLEWVDAILRTKKQEDRADCIKGAFENLPVWKQIVFWAG